MAYRPKPKIKNSKNLAQSVYMCRNIRIQTVKYGEENKPAIAAPATPRPANISVV